MQAIFSVTVPFFALILAGYLAARRRILPLDAVPGLNAFVLYFALPCLLFRFGSTLPVVTLAGIQAGGMIGGAVLTETVFAWPGIGRLMFDALLQRDYNLLLGCFLFTAAMAVLFNLITDFVYTLVDPRIELS